MSKMIQIRHVPDTLHRKLKVRAAELGMSLSDYLLSEIREIAAKPTLAQWLDNLAARPPLKVSESSAQIIRKHRDA